MSTFISEHRIHGHRIVPTGDALSGNQAAARGALEAGVRLATGYPGTPATPAIEYLMSENSEAVRVEWAVNEKVAVEMAAAHSWAGQRSFVAMKMSGVNVAADALLSVATSGTVGGLVLYVGDDPGMYYGMVEQDSRVWGRMAFLPVVEPGTPQEAKDLTREAYEISERVGVPVVVRGTTTTANTFAAVRFGEIYSERRQSTFPFDLDRYTKAGALRCLNQHREALRRLAEAGRQFSQWNTLLLESSRLGVIASASTWGYVQEWIDEQSEKPSSLRLVVANPFPEEPVRALFEHCETIIVIEELETVLEEQVRALATDVSVMPKILGKHNGLLPTVGDFDPDQVARILNYAAGGQEPAAPEPLTGGEPSWSPRLLTFCPGCPHRSSYVALEKALERCGYAAEDVLITGDIGCTILGMNPPHNLCRTEVAMGSSIAMAQGFHYAGIDRPLIAVLGDSTFFHAGIPPLLNASANGIDLTVLVLDNGYAAMTGYQETPGILRSRRHSVPNPVSIEEISKALRVRRVRKGLPYFTNRLSRVLARAISTPGVSVVIAEAPCIARLPRKNVMPFAVLSERCKGVADCKPSCLEKTACPALELDEQTGLAVIDTARCAGCGLCASACPQKAIRRRLRMDRRKGQPS